MNSLLITNQRDGNGKLEADISECEEESECIFDEYIDEQVSISDLLNLKCCNNVCIKEFCDEDVADLRICRGRLLKGSSKERSQFVICMICSSFGDNIRMKRRPFSLIGHHVCAAFLQRFCRISKKHYKRLRIHSLESGVCQLRHGNAGKPSGHRLPGSVNDQMRAALNHVQEENALPDPTGRTLVELPSCFSMKTVYRDFYLANLGDENPAASFRTFVNFWHKEFPDLKRRGIHTDYCSTCFQFRLKVVQITRKPEYEHKKRDREQTFSDWKEHLDLARHHRQLYKQRVEDTKKDDTTHLMLSVDAAENFFLPYDADQCGELFFLRPRKVKAYGIVNERTSHSHFVAVDEFDVGAKGSNYVMNLLNFHLLKFGLVPNGLRIQADNCWRQCKNQYFISFLMWLLQTNRVQEWIEMHFMIVGHTKFSPDRLFGEFHSLLKRANGIDWYPQVEELVGSSESRSFSRFEGPWYDFRGILPSKDIPNVSNMYCVRIVKRDLPYINLSYLDHDLLKMKFPILRSQAQPLIIDRPFLDNKKYEERLLHLFQKIRRYVTRPELADIVCPPPSVAPRKRGRPIGSSKRKVVAKLH